MTLIPGIHFPTNREEPLIGRLRTASGATGCRSPSMCVAVSASWSMSGSPRTEAELGVMLSRPVSC
jgi:hypothetical protein